MVAKKKNETDEEFRIRRNKYQSEYRKKNPPPKPTEEQKARAKELRKKRVAENPEKYRKMSSERYFRRIEYEKARQHEWQMANRENIRERDLKRQYGITIADYEKMLKEQEGVCAICFLPSTLHTNLDVDHCHETGKVRGLLCRNCNMLLGKAKDDPEIFASAIVYLEDRG